MMTLHEAQVRAKVNNCFLHARWNKVGKREWAARANEWSHDTFKRKGIWREDIEDAVLDCGRIRR